MKMLDQQITAAGAIAKEQFNLVGRGGVDLATLRVHFGPLAPFAGMLERADLMHIITH